MPTTNRRTTDWDLDAEHHHGDGSKAPMAEVDLKFGERGPAFPDLVANQSRTFSVHLRGASADQLRLSWGCDDRVARSSPQ